jgi:N-acetyl sugar amidotransferase|tara:strand:- start:371 stop:1603 length:1233 start_codon:yes stop_codon:yes gene_type:complete
MSDDILNSTKKIFFCKNCVESNKRYTGTLQYKRTKNQKLDTAKFDNTGVCLSCRYYEDKEKTDWKLKEKELIDILDKYRRNDGNYDVLVPGSGGKDSIFTSFILKEKYNMHPLTCTWAPGMYTDIGWKNFKSWIDAGFDNILFTPNKKVHKLLTKLAFKNLLNPFQPFILGQYYFPLRLATEKKIKLVIYGDGLAECSIGKQNINAHHQKRNISVPRLNYSIKGEEIFLGGETTQDIMEKYKLDKIDLLPFMPMEEEEVLESNTELLAITDYINYNPQNNFYFAKEKSGFQVNPDGRSEGTYTKYSSLDDKIDGFHYYTFYIKTGRGRATNDAALEVRNKIITRKEAVSLVKKYDGEFPKKYFKDFLNYIEISKKEFFDTIEEFRSQDLWKKENGKWVLKKAVWHKDETK